MLHHAFTLVNLLALSAASPAAARPVQTCADEIGVTAIATSLRELPSEIREDLDRMSHGDMVDRGIRIQQSDIIEPGVARSRFSQALKVRDMWFVTVEMTTLTPPTYGYVREDGGRYQRAPFYSFTGPVCAILEAVLEGVTTPHYRLAD